MPPSPIHPRYKNPPPNTQSLSPQASFTFQLLLFPTVFQNPANLKGPRGFILLQPSDFLDAQINGHVADSDLPAPVLTSLRLHADSALSVRSLAWSPLLPHSILQRGCQLAVCSTDGRLRVFRAPVQEAGSKWIQVADLSATLTAHLRDTWQSQTRGNNEKVTRGSDEKVTRGSDEKVTRGSDGRLPRSRDEKETRGTQVDKRNERDSNIARGAGGKRTRGSNQSEQRSLGHISRVGKQGHGIPVTFSCLASGSHQYSHFVFALSCLPCDSLFPVSAPPPLPISLPRPTTHHHQPLATPNGSPVTSLSVALPPRSIPAGLATPNGSPVTSLSIALLPRFIPTGISASPLQDASNCDDAAVAPAAAAEEEADAAKTATTAAAAAEAAALVTPAAVVGAGCASGQVAAWWVQWGEGGGRGGQGKGRGGQRGSGAGAAETNRESAEVVCEVGKRGKRKEIGGMDGCVTVGAWADAHAAAVTGVVVVVRGRGLAALYSCSQVDSIKCWSVNPPPTFYTSPSSSSSSLSSALSSALPSSPPSSPPSDFLPVRPLPLPRLSSALPLALSEGLDDAVQASRTDPSHFVARHGLAQIPWRVMPLPYPAIPLSHPSHHPLAPRTLSSQWGVLPPTLAPLASKSVTALPALTPCHCVLPSHAPPSPPISSLHPPSPLSQTSHTNPSDFSSRTDPSDFVGCHGLACSPNRLLIATVRDMAQHLKNDMYTKSFKAAVQLFWIAGQRLNPTTSPAAAPAAAPSASAASPMHTITSPNPPPEPLISHLLRCWGVPRRGKGATARRAREMVAWEQALRSSLCRLLNSGCFCCPSSCCCSCSCTRLQLRPSPFLLWDLLASLLSLAKQAASLPTTAAAASSTTPSSSTVLPSASLTASLCSPLSLLISLLLSELVWQQGTQEGEEEQLRVGVGRWSQVQQVQEGLRRMQKELQQRLALSVMVTAALCHGEERGNEMEGAERNEVGGGEVAGREAAGGEAAAGANKAAKGCMVQAAIDSCQWVLSQTTHTTTTAAAAATGGGDASSVGLNKATQEQTATEPTVLVHPLLTACAHAFAHWSGITTPATLPTPHHIPLCPVTLKPIEATQPAWHCLSCSRWISPEGMHCLDACRPLFLPPGSQNFWVRAEAWAERLKEATERTEAAEASGISGEAAANQLLPACMREMEATGEGKWVRGEEVTAAAAATTTMPVCPYCGVQVVAPTSCTLLSPSLV
ncbi:unnamed protein product [Closterium sp. Naga37s-1]|nr:unnamed protein product [Closterium sp. Naga37s-1]